MPGSICFKVPEGLYGRTCANDLANKVRAAGKREGIKVPKTISLYGCASLDFFISHTSNAMRDLIYRVAAEEGIVELFNHGEGKWLPEKPSED